jgi:C-terminal processing protease CtpA/Prc
MEQHAMHRDRIDWTALRIASARRAAGAATPADTYDAIRWALTQLEDGHSFFNPPERSETAMARGECDSDATVPGALLRTDRIGHLEVPGFLGSAQQGTRYADELQRQIAEMDAADPVGWMVDLTGNWGGNMWPMLAGLGPLLGEGPLGSFVFPHLPPAVWSYRAGQAQLGGAALAQTSHGGYRMPNGAWPLALLMSNRTASSGEAVLIAFAGRPNTRRFGTATRGLTTANSEFPMQDGATLGVTTGTYADRRGRVYGEAIEPDQYVDGDGGHIQTCAAAWIHAAGRAEESVRQKSAPHG